MFLNARGMELDVKKEKTGHDMYAASRHMVTGVVLVSPRPNAESTHASAFLRARAFLCVSVYDCVADRLEHPCRCWRTSRTARG